METNGSTVNIRPSRAAEDFRRDDFPSSLGEELILLHVPSRYIFMYCVTLKNNYSNKIIYLCIYK